jgi:hypothetical protein
MHGVYGTALLICVGRPVLILKHRYAFHLECPDSHLSSDPLLSDPSFRFTKLLTGEVFLAVQYNGIVRVSLGRHHNGYSIQLPQPTQMVFDPKSDIV